MDEITIDDYRKACVETYIIITNYLQEDLANKIPSQKLMHYKENMDKEYQFSYNDEIELEQQILYPTKCILANLFRDYIANEEEKKLIIQKEFAELELIEEEKRKKYSVDNIWGNNSKKDSYEVQEKENIKNDNIESTEKNLIILENEKNVYKKIIQFIKNIFYKKS